MVNINSINLIQFVREYFVSIGISNDNISNFFENNHFDRALILNLSAVCIMPKNKPATLKSNQTHIHVTGDPRYFFFPKADVDSKISSTSDKKVITDISLANIKALNKDFEAISAINLEIEQSFTLAKISHRKTQENQVQISKIKLDGNLFIDLRLGLYENDLLILLGYKGSDKLFAIGIPKEYYTTISSISTSVFFNLNEKLNIKIKTALKKIESLYDSSEEIPDTEVIDDSIYQQQVADAEPSETENVPFPKSGKTSTTNTHQKRNAARGKEAIKDGNYKCAFDPSHATFISKAGFPYIEAHHLIPISKEDDFIYSLDVKGNIIPLCPNCHAKIHYGKIDEVNDMIEQLYDKKKESLVRSGIEIDLDSLKKYYL